MKTKTWFAALVILAAGLGVYANGLEGPFVFDDHYSIVESPNVRSLLPLTEALSAPAGSVASGRPLVALSLALNHAAGGLEVFGYHLVNVVAHVLTALLLFALLARGLARTRLAEEATTLAGLAALLWVVHPLNTDALNQVVSRSEVFAAFFVLATLYAFERSCESGARGRWSLAAVLAGACAMASKEIAVALPLAVLFYDRTLVSGSFAAALRARRGLYGGLAVTWVVLALAIASGDRGVTVGFGQQVSSLDYLRTQAGGIPHYLRLAVFPRGLALDYSGWPFVTSWGPALLPGFFVLLLFAGSLELARRRRPEAVPALLFFAVLAPSSSFIPLAGERLAEHRMYLPLACLASLAVPVAWCGLRRALAPAVATALLALLALPLAWGTVQRNALYQDVEALWRDVLSQQPDNGRAHDQLAALLASEGRYPEALEHGREAVRLAPELNTAAYNLGTILMRMGRFREALPQFEAAEPFRSGTPIFHGNYGVVLGQAGRLDEALYHLRRALEVDPDYGPPHRNLGILLFQAGRDREALGHLRAALVLRAEPELMLLLGKLLAAARERDLRDGAEAERIARQLVDRQPGDPRFHDLLAMALAERGLFEDAVASGERALAGARQLGNAPLASELEGRLTGYRAGRPFRRP